MSATVGRTGTDDDLTPDGTWIAFRAEALRQVPGLPATAGRDFDITRHGALGHLQRVALRALADDLAPDLSPLAIETAATLGELADLVGHAALRSPQETLLATRVRGANQTERVALVPLEAEHIAALYRAATDPATGFRWRFRGRTPSPEEFHATLFTGVIAQHMVVSTVERTPIGLVVAYDEDTAGHHCHIGLLRTDDGDHVPGGTVEGLVLFIDHLFATFPYRKLFVDLPEYNLPLIDGIPDEVLSREGRMHEFYWHGGRYWDRCFASLSRDAWEQVVASLLP